MATTMYMEDVRRITNEVNRLIEDRLKMFGITLTYEQEDVVHDATFGLLEGLSTGDYRQHL